MKKWNCRSFFAGVITAVLILSTVGTAGATVASKTAKLDYNDIKITLDGKPVEPKDANGNTVEPFAINGTTYLPVRAVASALGLNVEWDGKTKTVVLSKGGSTAAKPSTSGMTLGQKNALEQANRYLDIMAFSRSGLIDQLEYEGYSTSDATFAVDRCGADWFEQAARSAKRYLEVMPFLTLWSDRPTGI